ncbi:hypothetical protein Cpap_3398 [Ruminiclostridium papyrosolvens DSM 2782]|uniref:Uncharacterized protein n=2 Tax=Ruminiclostridium papyrosolvens TaxID=29362 RepID=F1T8Y8_9FIRM|nr:hypothetical protein Cpap_3398 [Ruminiclostridium papyrosolvens DSM 2782]
MGKLMKKIEQEVKGVYITKECCQDLVKQRFSGPLITKYYGYCLAATGRWLVNPKDTENEIAGQKFQAETMNLQSRYEASRIDGDTFLGKEYPRELGLPVRKANYQLTSENLYNQIIYLKDNIPLTQGYMMLCIGEKPNKFTHALGVIINDGNYYFFDANEGFCSMKGTETFWGFIYHYVTNLDYGLLKQGYTHFLVALYNHQPS